MATDKIDYVVKFEIARDGNYWGIYKYRVDGAIEGKLSIEDIVDLGKKGKIKGNVTKPDVGKRPERLLDIIAKKNTKGVCLYLFGIDENATDKRLEFVSGNPFIPLPLNSRDQGDPRTFLKYVPIDNGKERLWAAFSCNLDDVRKSWLAQQIGKDDEEGEGAEAHEHPGLLNIPFSFNVVDPKLGGSPWAVPGHSDNSLSGHSDHKVAKWRMTHGGVHPSALTFLSVEL